MQSRWSDVIRVTCYSGRTYVERPQSFFFEGQAHKVNSIEKEWHEPRGKHFKE